MAGNGFVISWPSFAESCYVSFAPKQTRSSCLSLAVADFFELEWLLFPNFFSATLQPNAPHLIKQDYLGYILAWTIFAFDEGERVLVAPFLRKSHSRALWSSPKGIDRDAMRYQALGAILGCLTSYVAQLASISCANVFLAALSWRHRFFCAISTIQKTFCRDRTHFTNLWLLLVIVINQEMFWNFSHITFCFSTNSRNKKEINTRHILLLD